MYVYVEVHLACVMKQTITHKITQEAVKFQLSMKTGPHTNKIILP